VSTTSQLTQLPLTKGFISMLPRWAQNC